MKNKPRFAMYWASACGGCEIAVLNINEKILDIDSNFEIVFWPAIMDIKYCDVEKFDDQSIFITLFNGSIRNEENEEMARLLRRKSQILVAFGSCAVEGCIPGLANLFCVQEILDTTFHTISTDSHEISLNTNYSAPEGLLSLPLLNTRISTLSQIVNVDYFIPGCPPESQQISTIIDLLIKVVHGEAQLPPKGSIIGAGPSTVCDECPRKKNLKLVKKFFRIHEIDHLAPEVCILEQGVPCNGPATRSGCNARCPSIGAQCIGCYGPAEDVADCGARLISAFASIIDSNDPKEIENILGGIPDPVGQFYRFHLANSILRTGMKNWQPLGSKEKEDDNKPN